MKVLHVEAGRNLYGGGLQVLYLARGLDAAGHESILVCPRGSAIGGAASEAGIRVREIPMGGDVDVFQIGRLRRIIREEGPGIVHLHSRRGADLYGGLAARLEKVPAVLTRRVDNPEPAVWARVKYRLFPRVITISRAILDVLRQEGVPEQKLVCVHSAVDTGRFKPGGDRERLNGEFGLPANSLLVAMIAQFIERKGHRILLDALAEIRNDIPEFRVLLLGKGPLEAEMRSLAAARGLEDIVLFPGFRDDLERILPCLDLVVHPALMEGLGVALLQAAACGVPVVAARAGGLPEIVRDGENGVLVPPRDAAALGSALRFLLADPERRGVMGRAGRAIAEREFSIPAMVDGNLSVYREILGR